MPPFDPTTASLKDLAQWTGEAQPGSTNHTRGMAEFTKRQTESQLKADEAHIAAAKAEQTAAEAATKAASSAERNATYMLWSVIVAAMAAFASAFSAYFAWESTRQVVPMIFTPAAPTTTQSPLTPAPGTKPHQ